jgi:acyl carrier protein
MTDIQAQVRGFIQDNFIMGAKAAEFGPTDSFLDLHLIDSTGFLELITYLEETFGIVVKDAEMLPENLDSLQAIEAYLARKQTA